MSAFYAARPSGTGYTDHAGDPQLRHEAAKLLTEIGRLPPGLLDADKVFCVAGGTGGLNTALSIFEDGHMRLVDDKMQLYNGKTLVLVTDPFYPPWGPISERNNLTMTRFPLQPEDDFLLNKDILRKILLRADPWLPVVLMYHYPHNPTGKTLTEADAKNVAQTLSELVAEFPNLHLIQEDLYLATIRSDLGIYTPMQYLSSDALQRTILVHSPSKEGHGQDRGALVATPSKDIALRLRGSTAFSNLGMSTGALLGTVRTLVDIAKGIVPSNETNQPNHRYITADYYQERVRAIGQGFLDLEKITGNKILDLGIPKGTYYLWAKLGFLKGLPMPSSLQDTDFSIHDFISTGPATFESGNDIMHAFARAHRIGFVPIMVTPGDFFTDNKGEMRIRIAAVDRDINSLHEAANTIKGVIGTVMGLDLKKLGVKTRPLKELQETFKPEQPGAGFMTSFLAEHLPRPEVNFISGGPVKPSL